MSRDVEQLIDRLQRGGKVRVGRQVRRLRAAAADASSAAERDRLLACAEGWRLHAVSCRRTSRAFYRSLRNASGGESA